MFIAQVLVGLSVKLHKEIIQIENNMVKNPKWQEADQLTIYKRVQGVELGASEKQLQLAVRAGLEPGASGFQVRHPNDSTTLPPKNWQPLGDHDVILTTVTGLKKVEKLLPVLFGLQFRYHSFYTLGVTKRKRNLFTHGALKSSLESCFKGVRAFRVELEFGNVNFGGATKIRETGEKPSFGVNTRNQKMGHDGRRVALPLTTPQIPL